MRNGYLKNKKKKNQPAEIAELLDIYEFFLVYFEISSIIN